jgi:hypothetical protein
MATTQTTITFFDETGTNPFPPGVKVTIVNTSAALIAVAYTTVGGVITVALQTGTTYAASFVGTQAVSAQPVIFVSSPTTNITVPNYRSPALSATGYAQTQMEVLPNEDFPASALTVGGIAYTIGYGFGSGAFQTDYETQQTLAANRLQSCQNNMVDSWATDFIGYGVFPRWSDTDAAYIARIMQWLQLPCETLSAIAYVVQVFFKYFPDTSTVVDVFDTVSDPARAGYYGIVPGQVAIIAYYPLEGQFDGWYLGQSFLGQNTFFADPYGFSEGDMSIYPELQALVNAVKPVGVEPVYIASRGEFPNFSGWGALWRNVIWEPA